MRDLDPYISSRKLSLLTKKKLNQMLYNKKTVVALTAACLFALNDATKIE